MWNWDEDQPWNNQEPIAPDDDQSQSDSQSQLNSDANQVPLDPEQSQTQLDLDIPQTVEAASNQDFNNEAYINEHLYNDEHYNHIAQNVHSVDNNTGHGAGFSDSTGKLLSIRHAVDDSATFTSDDTFDSQAVKNLSQTSFDDNGHIILEASKNHKLDDLLVIKDNTNHLGDGKGLEITALGSEIHKNDQVEIYHNRDGSTKETSGQIIVAGEGLIHIDIGDREEDEFHGASGSPVILNNEVCGVIVGSQINQDNGHTELIAIAIGKDENGISVDYTDHHLGSVRDSIHEDKVHQVTEPVYVVEGDPREEVIVIGTRINDDNSLGSLFNNLTKNYLSGSGKNSSTSGNTQPTILGMLDNAINDLKKLILPAKGGTPQPAANEAPTPAPPIIDNSDEEFTQHMNELQENIISDLEQSAIINTNALLKELVSDERLQELSQQINQAIIAGYVDATGKRQIPEGFIPASEASTDRVTTIGISLGGANPEIPQADIEKYEARIKEYEDNNDTENASRLRRDLERAIEGGIIQQSSITSYHYAIQQELLTNPDQQDVKLMVTVRDDPASIERAKATFAELEAQGRLEIVPVKDKEDTAFWNRDSMPVQVVNLATGETKLVGHKYGPTDDNHLTGSDLNQQVAKAMGLSLIEVESHIYGGNILTTDNGVVVTVHGENNPRNVEYAPNGDGGWVTNNLNASDASSNLIYNYGATDIVPLPFKPGTIGDADEVVKILPSASANSKDIALVHKSDTSIATAMQTAGFEVRFLPDPPPETPHSTYTNSVIVNGTVFMPIFGSVNDVAAMDTYSQAGYKVIPVDSRGFASLQGNLHCLTMTYTAPSLSTK